MAQGRDQGGRRGLRGCRSLEGQERGRVQGPGRMQKPGRVSESGSGRGQFDRSLGWDILWDGARA